MAAEVEQTLAYMSEVEKAMIGLKEVGRDERAGPDHLRKAVQIACSMHDSTLEVLRAMTHASKSKSDLIVLLEGKIAELQKQLNPTSLH